MFLKLEILTDTFIKVLVLFSGLHHENPKIHFKLSLKKKWSSPLFSELVDCMENVKFVAGHGVNLSHDLVHTNECAGAAHPGTAVDQERPSVWTQGVGGQQDMGELDNGDQVTASARGAPIWPICQLKVDHNTVTTGQIGLTRLGNIKLAHNVIGSLNRDLQ